jgi:hypothetical protein
MRGSTTDRVLPSGFVWHRDAHGFGFGVPDRWLRSRDKGTYCFRDPAGGRGFTVTGLASAVPDKAAYWRGLERTAQKDLPGYHRVSLAAAGWEYTWKPSDGVVRHSRQVLLTPGAGSAYVLNWTSADAQWTADQPIVQEAVSSFALDPSPAS